MNNSILIKQNGFLIEIYISLLIFTTLGFVIGSLILDVSSHTEMSEYLSAQIGSDTYNEQLKLLEEKQADQHPLLGAGLRVSLPENIIDDEPGLEGKTVFLWLDTSLNKTRWLCIPDWEASGWQAYIHDRVLPPACRARIDSDEATGSFIIDRPLLSDWSRFSRILILFLCSPFLGLGLGLSFIYFLNLLGKLFIRKEDDSEEEKKSEK